MSVEKKPFLFDRDNLNQVFGTWRNKELLHAYGFKTKDDLYASLISKKSVGAEYIVGVPGVGKTSFALESFGAKTITTKEDIKQLLSLDFDDMVFVTSDVEDEIAQQAKRITLLHASSERVHQQRKIRDEEIINDTSKTAFGRSPRSTAPVPTDGSILVSRLKTDYEDKSRIVMYRSHDPQNRDTRIEIPMNTIDDKRKYIEAGVVAGSGKRSPAQIVHMEYQLKRIVGLSKFTKCSPYVVIGKNSGGEYDLGLTQKERMRLIDLVIKGELQYIFSGTPDFLKNKQGKIIKIVPEKSYAILGKERLPEGFTHGSYNELVEKYPQFLKHKDSYAVKSFVGYNFINMGNITMEGSTESVSATFVRKCLVEGNIDAVQPYLSPEIFAVLTKKENLLALQRRYSLIKKRDEELEAKKQEMIQQYKMINPVTGQPLLTKKCEPKKLSKSLADSYSTKKDKAIILDYLERIEKKIKQAERVIKKKYNKKIYAEENKLHF